MAQTSGHAAYAVGLRATIMAAALALVGPAPAQTPRVGEVRRVRAVAAGAKRQADEDPLP